MRDNDLPPGHHRYIVEHKQELESVADQVLAELYGPAGVSMSFRSRNALLDTCQACHWYIDGTIDFVVLKDSFWDARRQLRADVQLQDIRTVEPDRETLIRKAAGGDA